MEFDRWTVVVLRRPADSPQFTDEELEVLQQKHLAHLARLKSEGFIAVGGPFTDQSDERMRGMSLYRTEPARARELAEQDPMVLARRLEVEVLTWLVPSGTLPLQQPDDSFPQSG